MDLNLTGKTALVGGASQGIGRAICLELASLGANIIAMARRETQLKEVISECNISQGQQHRVLASDIGDLTTVKAKIEQVLTDSTIDIVINNTAGPKPGLIKQAEAEEFTSAFNNHLQANRLLFKLVYPGMKAKQFGRIINITSTSVKVPIPNLGVSNTIRAAVAAWAKTLSQEVASEGITVNTVLPGFTATERLDSLVQQKAKANNQSIEQVSQTMQQSVPMKRFGQASEIAAAVAFLASPAASYINGVALSVDGGRTGCY